MQTAACVVVSKINWQNVFDWCLAAVTKHAPRTVTQLFPKYKNTLQFYSNNSQTLKLENRIFELEDIKCEIFE